MRLKAEIWVKAYLRTCFANGAFAAIVRHGDDDAGAILIRINRLDGRSQLFVPVAAGFDGAAVERRWQPAFQTAFELDQAVEDYIEQELRFDPDVWLIEVEDRAGRDYLGDQLKQ
jgi:hypothetical protein